MFGAERKTSAKALRQDCALFTKHWRDRVAGVAGVTLGTLAFLLGEMGGSF